MTYEITRGKRNKPVKAVCYGVEGVGKTTFAGKWPGAVFIDIEDGSGHYDVARMPRPTEWLGLLAEIEAAAKMPEIGTLVIDTADAAEALCISHVLTVNKKKGLEDFGYGKGYTYLGEEFAKLLAALDKVTAAGKNVLVLAHAQIRKFEQPDEMGAYDRWELKLQKKCAPLVKEWCDLLMFANYKTDVIKDPDGTKAKAVGGKKRVMYAVHSASWDAKNRLGLLDEMPFDFSEIEEKIPKGSGSEPKAPEAEVPAKTKEPPREDAQVDISAKSLEFVEVTEPEIKELHKLMELGGVNEAQLRTAVGNMDNNPYTDETPIAEYSIKFVGNLLKHWDEVAGKARAASSVYDEDIPF